MLNEIDQILQNAKSTDEFPPDFVEKSLKLLNKDIIFKQIGGFTSPGYYITCYAIVYVKEGKPIVIPWNYEIY